jgi:sugar (pentulose or hexulose) kinase
MDINRGIAILDVGKTNKKLIVFDQNYRIVLEDLETLQETIDEDGFPCEDLPLLNQWLDRSIKRIGQIPNMAIRAINFSAYGASLVNITRDNQGTVN